MPIVLRISELIRFAFNASTNKAERVRVAGLSMLGTVLQMFAPLSDPDFPDSSIMEQYQAQINAGLALSFANVLADDGSMLAIDVMPLAQATSLDVCQLYITSGISTSANAFTRITKLLMSLADRLFATQPAHMSYHCFAFAQLQFLQAVSKIVVGAADKAYLQALA